jgi:hypothetical protein
MIRASDGRGRPRRVDPRSYPSVAAASSTRRRVCADSSPRPLSAREALPADTPASDATSASDGLADSITVYFCA